MSDQEFKPGDVVTLKSGGPSMTVFHNIGEAGVVAWYCEFEHRVKTADVPLACLERSA